MPDPDSSSPWYDNRSLFSDHYLEERLPHGDAWEEDVSEAWTRARKIWEDTGDRLEGLNEAQTEDEFIRPVLENVLGFERTVQTGVRHRERLSRPDYLLFADEEAKRRSEDAEDDAGRYEPAVAVADAKYWGRPLDRHLDDARDALSHANPSFQIVDYLVATGVEWGILTNGARWRLYFTGARSRIDTFYEADLERILRDGDEDAFRWFQLFFRAAAFVPAPQSERSFLASVHQGSVEYGARLESQLKELIFEDIFLHLARGFLEDWQGNGNGAPDQEQLDEIYQGTLRLLYRLLFLLHAEARGLLPVEQRKGYRGYSLRSVVRDAAEMLDEGATLSAVSTNLWNDLDSLFRIIDRGESDLDVPHYDGGLFRQGHPDNAFLENHAVADRHLVPALDLLAREQERDDRGRKPFVDYKTLNVQQLGSIYEGLLEFRLRRAEEELAVVKEDGSEVYEPASELDEPRRTVAEGELYLMNDKGERKATGSYYTPHYIVEYIVEHTLGPVLEEREERFRELMGRLEDKPGDNLVERKAVDALLGIKVCDPAMGSGHFLVHAVDWLAEHIIAILNEFPGNPLLRKIEGVRDEILGELDDQHVQVDPDRLTDTGLLKRMVMKRCIYGVDLNPMAVELAKLSLWLDSFTVGAPLSFLDHHLKQGNSLIGTTVDEVREALEAEEGQFNLFTGPFTGLLQATEMIREIGEYADVTFDQVEESATLYESFQQKMEPYKRVLDLWVSRHFGNDGAESLLRSHGKQLLDSLRPGGAELPGEQQMTLEDAELLQQEKSFFHWELEFPEIFIDLSETRWKENPGFDAVVGNPPWGAEFTASEKQYLNTFTTRVGKYDSYRLFMEQGLRLTRHRGCLSFITPSYWLVTAHARRLRHLILTSSTLRSIVLLPDDVFAGVKMDALLFVTHRGLAPSRHDTAVQVHDQLPSSRDLSTNNASLSYAQDQRLWLANYTHAIQVRLSPAEQQILAQIGDSSRLLDELFEVTQGLTLYRRSTLRDRYGKDEAERIVNQRAFHSNRREHSAYKKQLGGSEVDRYYHDWGGTWVKYGDWLAHKVDQRFFTQPRLVLQKLRNPSLSRRLIATYLNDELTYNDGTLLTIIPRQKEYSLLYLLALLNSSALNYWYRATVSDVSVRVQDVRRIPIQVVDVTAITDWSQERVDREAIRDLSTQCFDADSTGPRLLEPDRLRSITGLVPDQDKDTHDLLAFLANEMLESRRREAQLRGAADPFKFISRSIPLRPAREVFKTELNYATRLGSPPDLSAVHHDLDGLRFSSDTGQNAWVLEIQLKKRDSSSDWDNWIREDDGQLIAREWVPGLKFMNMEPDKARYYQRVLPVLEHFSGFTSFPAGKTRSTMEKFLDTPIPTYDQDTDLKQLSTLGEELEAVQTYMRGTDTLIDQTVCRLYGLSDEEIRLVLKTVSEPQVRASSGA